MTKPEPKIKPPDGSARATPAALLRAVAAVLQPLVKLLIARGVTYQVASEMLKRVYVRAGHAHFARESTQAPTGTQLSLLTGLNRKEIRRLNEEALAEVAPASTTSFAAAVHAAWLTRRPFRDARGRPRVLPRHGDGSPASFDTLVRSVTTDHRPAAVLEELRRLALVDLRDDGSVALRAVPFLSRDGDARLIPFAENLGDHAQAAVSNVLADPPPFLERAVFSDDLSPQAVAALQQLVADQWRQVHDDLINAAIAQEEEDASAGRTTGQRIRVGMYFYSEPVNKEES